MPVRVPPLVRRRDPFTCGICIRGIRARDDLLVSLLPYSADSLARPSVCLYERCRTLVSGVHALFYCGVPDRRQKRTVSCRVHVAPVRAVPGNPALTDRHLWHHRPDSNAAYPVYCCRTTHCRDDPVRVCPVSPALGRCCARCLFSMLYGLRETLFLYYPSWTFTLPLAEKTFSVYDF